MANNGTISPIPLSVPELTGNEWTYVKECLDTGWVSSVGPFVDRFEREIAAYAGSAHAVAVVNGTAALHIALRVVGVQPEDEVLVSTLSFIAPANAIRYCQAHPVFFDAHPHTWQMDVEKVRQFLQEMCEVRSGACINRRTGRVVRAILPVHILGLACEMDAITDIARQHCLRIVEDAAEAVGVRYRGRHPGTFGDIGVLSFNGNKIITCGGGGMLLTSSADYAKQARYLTTQAKDDEAEYVHHAVGYNYRLTNLQAAVGVAQLEQIDAFVAKKRAIAATYEAAFSRLPAITLMPTPPHTESSYWLYTILLDSQTTLADRQQVMQRLQAAGIGVRPLWHPLHRLPPYRQCETVSIEHADRLYVRALSLPCSVGLQPSEQQRCIAAVTHCVANDAVLC